MRQSPIGILGIGLLTLVLNACGSDSDRATRSPDLPAPVLDSIDVTCIDPATATASNGPITLVEGQTTQCMAQCVYRVVDQNGTTSLTPAGACDDLSWSAGACLNVDANGGVTATCPTATTRVTGQVDGGSDFVTFTVTAVAVDCTVVYPRGVIVPDPLPPPNCAGFPNFATSAPVGVTVPFRAAVRLNNGNLCYAPDAPAGFNACPQGLITFAAVNDPVASPNPPNPLVANFPNPPNGLASTLAQGEADVTATGSINQVDLTVTAPILNAQLCVESVAPAVIGGCAAYPPGDPVVCAVDPKPNIVAQGAPFQFYARAFFNVGLASAQVCDVTFNPDTTWDITLPADAGSNAAANPSVANTPNQDKGKVSGGDQATTDATVRASFTDGVGTASGSHLFNVVVSQVIARNSLLASSETVSNDPASPNFAQGNHAACVASFNLLDSTPLPVQIATQARLFGVLRRCPSNQVQPDGSCPAASLATTLEDVTNAEPVNNVPLGRIAWTAQPGVWDTTLRQCTAATSLITAILGPVLGNPGLVGDNDAFLPAPPRYTVGAAFPPGAGDARIFGASGGVQVEDNGVAIGASTLGTGAACVTATYTEGTASTTDGVTVIVFPVNEGSLLLDPSLAVPQLLCDLVTPLLQ